MDAEERKGPLIVSFSGIDGAGKSTQIESLVSWLESAGLKVTVLRMWDDIVAGRALRETASHYAFRGDRGIGTPERPLLRRDKNVRSPLLSIFRCCLYLADALSLWWCVRTLEQDYSQDVVIFDRYIYDELANLYPTQPLGKKYAELVLKVAPHPDIAYVVDVEPEAARARKPEYPLDFLRINRESFLALCTILKDIIVIETPSLSEASETIRESFLARTAVPRRYSPLPAMRG